MTERIVTREDLIAEVGSPAIIVVDRSNPDTRKSTRKLAGGVRRRRDKTAEHVEVDVSDMQRRGHH